jgi:hypothetical protein
MRLIDVATSTQGPKEVKTTQQPTFDDNPRNASIHSDCGQQKKEVEGRNCCQQNATKLTFNNQPMLASIINFSNAAICSVLMMATEDKHSC